MTGRPPSHPGAPDDRDDHDDFGGFTRDVTAIVSRRRALQLFGGVGLAGLVAACSGARASSSSSTRVPRPTSTGSSPATTAATATTMATTAEATSTSTTVPDAVPPSPGPAIPRETQGPFPADGSNGPNLLTEPGVVRADLRASFAGLSGTADGVPLAIRLTVVDAANGSPLPGAAVYLWHCTADGRYSVYEIEDQNHLRGVQVADAAGRVAFTSVFPGCYGGRWPHCHFEVYDSLDVATAGSQARRTSQLALPQADCEAVYADARYGPSASNLSRLSLDTDNVFRDGWADQLAVVAGSVGEGYTASLLVRV